MASETRRNYRRIVLNFLQADICVTQAVWGEVWRAISETLERLTLADLVARHNALPRSAHTYSI